MGSTARISASIAALAWDRPLGLVALALPILVLALHRARARPEPSATGTLALWREVRSERSSEARARRAIPPRLWLLAAALVFASLALAGPHPVRPPRERTWRVVVDRSPSMYLPIDATGGRTRLDAALAELEPFVRERLQRGDRFMWSSPSASDAPSIEGERPPAAWLAPPERALDEPAWARFDAPGVVWLTDRAPELARRSAGSCASGGVAVPGVVGRDRAGLVAWDGERLVDAGRASPPPSCALVDEGELPQEVRQLFALWAEDRGLATEGGALELALRGVAGELAPELVDAARDGWSVRARAAIFGAPSDEQESWLASSTGAALVRFEPGAVDCALRSIEELGGDPVAFALSWAALFDAARLPPAGAVSVAERAAAGAARFEAPTEPAPEEDGAEAPFPLAASLALAAFALALAALWRG